MAGKVYVYTKKPTERRFTVQSEPWDAALCTFDKLLRSKNFLSAFFISAQRFDLTDADIRTSVKAAAQLLNYPTKKASLYSK